MSLKNLSVKIKIPKLLENKLKNKRIRQVYKKFKKSLDLNEKFAVAVSGGPDSMALAFLSKIYALERELDIKFFIIDHKLRDESTIEAAKVRQVLKKNNINVEILSWSGRRPVSNIQSKARFYRYKLLIERCNKLGIRNILLGHHQDDLYENFFIRMLRGSGLKGLISLDEKTKDGSINLLRPLLSQKKNDLIFISDYVFNFYVKDPSNYNDKFKRITIRNLIKELQNNGLNKKKFMKTLKNLKSSNKVVEFYVKENLKKNSFFSKKNKDLILNKNFFNQPNEIVFRSLSESIKKIGENYYFVRGKKLDRIISEIGNNRDFKVTLGSCIIKKVNETVILSKEY